MQCLCSGWRTRMWAGGAQAACGAQAAQHSGGGCPWDVGNWVDGSQNRAGRVLIKTRVFTERGKLLSAIESAGDVEQSNTVRLNVSMGTRNCSRFCTRHGGRSASTRAPLPATLGYCPHLHPIIAEAQAPSLQEHISSCWCHVIVTTTYCFCIMGCTRLSTCWPRPACTGT